MNRKINKNPMGLDPLLDNTDKSSKHIMHDKQVDQVTPKITL